MGKYNFFVILIFLLISQIQAFDRTGHLLVAQIAKDKLHAFEKINDYLSFHNKSFPEYSDFVRTAVWPDEAWRGEINLFKNWHFIRRPYNPNSIVYDSNYNNTNIVWALENLYDGLKSESSEWGNSFMMSYLINLVGDIHQPFNNIELFNDEFTTGDKGGSLVKVYCYPNMRITDLYTFWNSGNRMYHDFRFPLTENDMTKLKTVSRELVANYSCPKIDNIDFEKWSQESYYLAIKEGYKTMPANMKLLNSTYIDNAREIYKSQIVKAGCRLAHILNSVFKKEIINKYEWDFISSLWSIAFGLY